MKKTLKPAKKKLQEPDFHEKTLAPFNIDKFYYIPVNSYLIAEKLLLVSQPAPTGNYNIELMKNVRSLYQNYYIKEPVNKKYPEKIYISRAKALRRRIINEKEVIALLHKYGFTDMFFEDLSFEEQVRHAYFSKYVISLHGAGLTNILFMQDGARVLELSSLDNTGRNLCYYSLANALNVKYHYQFCRKADEKLSVQAADVFVDLEQLESNLKSFII